MVKKGLSYLFNTENGKNEYKIMIKDKLPKIISKRKIHGFYSTDTIDYRDVLKAVSLEQRD
jgi:hypothetical protein